LAAVAAGASGLIVEVHPNPERALSDGFQSLFPHQFRELAEECRAIAGLLQNRRASAEAKLVPALTSAAR
jgi:3-deoxy-7-phosphoheptulonate synthase